MVAVVSLIRHQRRGGSNATDHQNAGQKATPHRRCFVLATPQSPPNKSYRLGNLMNLVQIWWEQLQFKFECLMAYSAECRDFLLLVSYGCLVAGGMTFGFVAFHYLRWRQRRWDAWMAEQQKTYVNELAIKERRWIGEDNPEGMAVPDEELKRRIKEAVEQHRRGNGRVITP